MVNTSQQIILRYLLMKNIYVFFLMKELDKHHFTLLVLKFINIDQNISKIFLYLCIKRITLET